MTNDWRPLPGLYRLFELGHVVAADGVTEYQFEVAGRDSAGAALIKVYGRRAAEPAPPRDLSRVAVRTCPISGLESHR